MSFSNRKEDILKNINNLPDDILFIIKEYIPNIVIFFLTKKDYIQFHPLIRQYINNRDIEMYIRTMVRQDNDFVLNQLLKENSRRWLDMKKYYYKNCIYSNYITFLESYAIDNESIKCRQLILKLFEELGLSKNQHKKNKSKYIRWTTSI